MRDALFFSKLRVLLCGWRWKHHRRASWLKAKLRRLRHRMQRASSTITLKTAPPRSSPFLLEPLESRLLLAADLTGVVQSAALLDPAVPTNNASAVVQVQNIGNQRVNQSQIGVYASLDTVLDSSDVLLGTANTGQVNAGASKNVTVNLTLPSTLDPVPYKLLAKFDNANAIAENSETNNVAVGGTINGTWKFGAVLGRAGNTTLTLRDADGTRVTFSLSGPGTGEVIKDGNTWDVKITGTTASSAVSILTNGGGNGRVTLNDIHVFGPLSTFLAATTDLTGTLAIDGPVNIPGLLPGTLTLGSIQGGTVAVPSVEALTILGSTTNAKIYVGITLGQDGQPGGTGANADTYGQGTIGLFTVTGAMSGTAVRVGINPVDGLYGNGNDQLVGGTASSISGIVIGGALSADTRFYAGAFPAQYLHGLMLKPTAGDFHFVSNFGGPNLTAALQQDTGSSTSDQLTNNPAITGSVTDPQGIATFVAGFGATPTVNVLADRQADGSFTFTHARLEQISGVPLIDGTYVLKLLAADAVGNSTQISVAFTLDTQIPTLTLDLAAASDTAPVGDQQTTESIVTLVGQTEALASLLLLETSATTQADASGHFTFANVALNLGANSFTVRATDAAGNQRTATRTITRLLADSDGDGVPDTNEGGGPNGGDANQDGIPDSQQANVASLQNSVDQQYVTLVSPTGTQLINVQAGPVAPDAPVGVDFPFGEIGFEVHGVAPGGSAQVTFLLPTGSLVNSFYKYGPEPAPGNTTAHWYDFAFSAVSGTGATISGDTVTLNLVDGARGDADLTANGVIVDPSAPGRSSNQPPTLAPIGPQSVNEGSELRFTVTATDPNPGDNLFLGFFPISGSLVGEQFVPNGVNTYEFIWTPGEADGPGQYQVRFDVFDGVNPPSSELVTITVNEVNQAPEIIVTGLTTVDEENFLELTVRGLDLDFPLNVLSPITVTGLPPGATFDQISIPANVYSLQWTPGEAQGPGAYDVTFTVSDDQGATTSRTVSLTVNEVNLAPVIESIAGPATVDEQTEWQAVVTASDPDLPANTLTATLDAADIALGAQVVQRGSTNVWDLLWTPSEAQGPGDYTFTVTVSDGQAAPVDQSVAVHVDEVNVAPVLAPIGSKTVVEGTRQLELAPIGNKTVAEATPGLPPLSFTVTATNQGPGVPALMFKATAADGDVPMNNLTFSLEAPSVVPPGAIGGVPSGATIHATGGDFVWNLDESHVGNVYAFDVVVKDGTGATNDSDRETITVTVTGDGQPNNLTFSLENEPAGATINSTTGLFEWAPTESQGGASYTFDVVVSDGIDADRETITVMVNEVNRPPVVSAIAPQTIDEETVRLVPLTATDPDVPANALTFELVGAPAWATIEAETDPLTPHVWQLALRPDEAAGIPGLGDYSFTVRVNDNAVGTVNGALQASQPVTVHVDEVNRAPLIISIDAPTVVDEITPTPWQAVVTASDPDLPANSLTATLAPADRALGAQLVQRGNTNVWDLLWTPNEAQGPGDYTFTVTVSDQVPGDIKIASQSVTVHVNEVNLPPVLEAIGNQSWTEEETRTIVLNATDPDRPLLNTLTYGATGLGGEPLPAGASFDVSTRTFSWRPTEAQGGTGEPFTVVFTVTDDGTPALSASETITITVKEVNQEPVLALILDQTMDEQTERRVPIIVSDPDEPANQLVVDLVTGPAWATIEEETDLLTPHAWELVLRPGEEQGPDDYALNVRVRDNAIGAVNGELMASQFVSVHVDEVNRDPVVSIAGPPTASEGMLWQAVVTASDPDIPANQLSADLDPASRALGAELVRRGTTNQWDLFWTPSVGNGSGGGTSAASFQGLGDLPGGTYESRLDVVSGNGAVVVGQSVSTNGSESYRWTPAGGAGSYTLKVLVTDTGTPALIGEQTVTVTVSGGMEVLSSVTGLPLGEVRALSFDGSVLVGKSAEGTAFRWSQIDGFQIIAGEGSNFTAANAVSSDGSIVVGGGYIFPFPPASAFRWTAATGAIRLGNLSGYDNSEAFAVSNDGNVIVGVSYTGLGIPYQGLDDQQAQAVRWVADGLGGFTVEALGDLPGGNVMSNALAVSADGTVIVGVSESDFGRDSFRWTATEGMQRLGDGALEGALEGAFGVSADGSVIVGGNQGNPFVWDTNNGVRSLSTVLFDLGVPGMDGWTILSAVGISADGRTIVGEAFNPQGDIEAWRAVLPVNAFAPVFNTVPVGNYQVQAGQNISFVISATDDDTPSQLVQYRLLGNVPSGVTLNGGTFSWDPTTGDVGDHDFTIRAYDSGVPSRFTDVQFSITVTA